MSARPAPWRALFLGLALCGGALAGCGWQRGLVAPEDGARVGVEVFRLGRDVFERGLEAELHAELTRAVSDLVGARLVAPERADWVLRGTIEGYRRRGGIRSRENQLRETAVQLDIRAELVARRDGRGALPPAPAAAGRPLPGGEAAPGEGAAGGAAAPDAAADRTTQVRVWSGYGLDVPTNERPARQRALRFLAETIVLDLFAQPPPDPQGPS